MKFLTRLPVLILSGCIALAIAFYFQTTLNPVLPQGASSMIQIQLAFSPERFAQVFDSWSITARQLYLSSMVMDFIFPAAYAFFLASILARQVAELPLRWGNFLCCLPFIAASGDYIENTLHILLIQNGAPYSAALVFIASVFSGLKWVLLAILPILILCLGIRRFLKRKR